MAEPHNFGPFESQTKHVLFNLFKYFEKEVMENKSVFKTPLQLVVLSTGVSLRTMQRIIAESKTDAFRHSKKFSSPKKTKLRGCPTALGYFDKEVMRKTVYNFYLIQREFPTVASLHEKLKEHINYQYSISTLRKEILALGFRWQKTEDNRKVLLEKHSLRHQRIQFLAKITEYRIAGRHIVYTEESYLQEPNKAGTTSAVKKSVNTGNRYTIFYAGGNEGYVPNSLHIFKKHKKVHEYCNIINHEQYEKWISEKLLPNLKPYSIVVVNNTAYHNQLQDPPPTSNSLKQDMIEWLHKHYILHSPSMSKPILFELIKKNRERFFKYKLDEMLKEFGHSVLRLPPFHKILNPLENVWSAVRSYVESKSVSMTFENIMELARIKMESVTNEEWGVMCELVKEEEEKFRTLEEQIDLLSDRFIFCSNNTSDGSNSDFESDG